MAITSLFNHHSKSASLVSFPYKFLNMIEFIYPATVHTISSYRAVSLYKSIYFPHPPPSNLFLYPTTVHPFIVKRLKQSKENTFPLRFPYFQGCPSRAQVPSRKGHSKYGTQWPISFNISAERERRM